MDKYDKKLVDLTGKVADKINENAMIIVMAVSFFIAALLV